MRLEGCARRGDSHLEGKRLAERNSPRCDEPRHLCIAELAAVRDD
jgi:hypothetical protein